MELKVKKELTQADKEIVESINSSDAKISFLQKLKGKRNNVPENVFRLREIESLGGIRYVVPYVFHANQMVQQLAIEKVHELFIQAESKDLNWLDQSIRGGYYVRCDLPIQQVWWNLEASHVPKINGRKEALASVLSILSFHSNGFVREAALKRLTYVDGKAAVKMLFLRVNDWVDAIRGFATRELSKLISEMDESQLADFLFLLEQLRSRSRQDHRELISQVESRYKTEKGQKEIVSALNLSDYKVCRSAFFIAKKVVRDKGQLLSCAAQHEDPVIRSLSLNLAKEVLYGKSLVEYLLNASKDKLGMLRKKAIYALLDVEYGIVREVLIDTLTDNSHAMRHMARFYLEREENFGSAKHYRSFLKANASEVLKGAILGLAETGDEADWEIVKAFEFDKKPKVRAAVISASEKLLANNKQWLFGKLVNGGACEVKAAKNVLLSLNNYSLEEVEEIHSQNSGGYVGKALRQLIAKKEYWHGARALTNTMLRSSENLNAELTNWLNKYGRAYWFVKPEDEVLVDVIENSKKLESQSENNEDLISLRRMTEQLHNWKI